MIVNYFTKKSIVCKFFAAIVFLFSFSTNLSAQLTVTPGVSAATLVTSLVGQGLTVSNINLNCPTNAYGTFANGNTTNMGITNGILLTTGSAVNAIGPNNSGSAGTCNGTSGSDPQLSAIEPLATEDLCVLEFDIVPQCNNLQVRFVFGSEEYPEFVNSSFNDAFGFFITGPGPACQAGFYNNTNVATLPNNVTPVSIDNVNAGNNAGFYVNNTGGTTIQYDGFTTILTRNISLCPCQTYHWKLAIADAGDCVYDSGVFVDFIACSNALSLTTSFTNSGCSGCTGTATVTTTGGTGPFTYSWAPSGGTGATASNLCPGTYTVTVTDALSCSPTSTAVVTIGNTGTPITLSGSQTNVLCNGQCTGSATVNVVSGTGPFTYSWAPSGGTAATTTGRCAGTYTVTVTGAGGCTATQTFNITQPPALTATQSQVNVLCNGQCTGSATVVAAGGTPGYTYSWAPSGGTAATTTGRCAGTYTCTITDANGCTITRTFNITQPPALTSTGSQVNLLCNGVCNGSATVVASGGTAPYTYSWAPSGGTAATASALCAGTFTCTITDANGCTTTRSFTITQPPALTATQSQVNILCNGQCTGSATVVASGGTAPYTYSWAPSGGTAATATGRCAGTYTVTITDANGCAITRTFNITQPPALSTTGSQVNVLCNGQCTGSATVVASGGTAPYTYSWAPSGGTAATASALCIGTYTVTVTDANGCTTTRTFSITQPPALTATQSQVNVLCNGQCTGSATVVPSGGTAPYTYSWAPSGGTAATTTGRCAGTYTVTITDANGCIITRTFNITQPPALTATQSQVNILCNGQCTGSATVVPSGGTAPYTYAWAPSGGTAATTTGRCAGTYTVTITDANGCAITRTFNITQPPALSTTGSQVNVLCNGSCTGSATVVASGGTAPYTYSWAPSGGTAATASALCAGTYTVTVTDANGCTTTRTFSITQPPALTATQSQVNVLCNGQCTGSATVVPSGGTAPYTYAWAPSGGTAATASGRCVGTYTCTITDANGCTITRTFNITQPPAMTTTQSQVNILCNGACTGSATVVPSGGTAPYTYAWAPSGGTAATATGRCAGTYTVTVTDANGCTITASFNITQPPAMTTTGSQVNLTCNAVCNGSATVVPSGGAAPYTYSWAPSGGTAATASSLCAGTYTVTVTDANGCTTTRTFTITQPPAITATQSQVNVVCNGQCTGSATVVASGGTGTYTYAWAPSGGTAATATGLCAGTYTCTISSPVGCSITQTFNITQPTAVTASTTTTAATCGGTNGTATVTASGGVGPYTYSWAPSGGTGATATGLAAGSYTVTVTSTGGCTVTAVAVVPSTGGITASITASTNVSCFGGSNGSATATPIGGTAPFTYAWTPSGGTAATATGLVAGSYTCTITDVNGCIATASVTITQPPALTATQSQVNVLCNGACTGSATVVASGGTAPYTYAWTPSGGTAATATGRCAGTYTCTITDANGCSITRTFNITQPTAITGTTSSVSVACNGGTNGTATVVASGGTPGYTYSWAPSGGTGATTTGVAAGTYTVTITDANGCTGTATVTITQPTAVTASTTTVSATCGNPNGSATVTPGGGVGPYTYSWAPSGGTGTTASGLLAGSYTVTVTDSRGCTTTAIANVPNSGGPTASISASTNVTCFGGNNGSATVTVAGGTAPYTYAWAPSGGTGATANTLIAGSYTVTVTDANGCTATATATITQPPVITATQSQVNVTCNAVCNGSATVVASGGTGTYTYAWAPSGGTAATATGLCAGTYTVTISSPAGCSITQSFTITQPTPVTGTTTTIPVACNGGSTGSVTVTPAGGTPGYTYSWAPSGGTGATTTGVPAGNYTVTITDASGCTGTASAIVTQPTAITATTTTVTATCGNPNGSATVTAGGGTPGYTYSWAPSGGTGATASGLLAGTYTVTVTDANGCTRTATATIINSGGPSASISASTNVSCFGGSNGSATVAVVGGTAPLTYAWAPSGGTGATATGLSAGSYTVTVTDANGCTSTASVTITQPPALTASATSTPVLCNGGTTGTATVTPGGGTPAHTYSWAPSGGTGATATGLAAGTYTCTVTDANGCTITATTTVTQPTAVTATNSTTPVLCNGGTTGTASVVASNGTPGYTYSWAPSGGTGATASNLAAGTYTCTITDANGCSITSSVTVTQPTAVTATSTTVTAICGNPTGSATVTPAGGTPGYTFSWAPSGGTGATASNLAAGTYTCTITDANGCSITHSVTIVNAGSPTAAITASTNILCFGGNNGSATVTASSGTAPYTYSWAPSGGTGATATGLIAGSYTVTVTDANGCTTTASVTLTEPPVLTASATSTPVLCNGGSTGTATVTAGGGSPTYTYSWAPSGGTGATATGLAAGTYTCTVTDANGCTTTATTTVTQPTAITATNSTTPVLCNGGNTGTASVVASGGTPGYTYSWAPSGGTGATATGLAAGTYTCTITDANGCSITSSVTVTEPTALTLATSFVQSTCGNANGSASVVASGATPAYTYAWAPSGGTGATATGLIAGSYTVTVTDANGCTQTATVVVPNAGSPTAAITASTNILCFGGNNGSATVTGSGGTPPYTYAWAPSGGTGATATGLIAGSYTVTVTDANGCTTTASVTLTEPPVLTASATSTPALCNAGATGSATVTAGGGAPTYTYSWAPSGGTGATATGLVAGTYTCTVTDANGCTTTATTTVTEPTQLTATISTTPVLCNAGNTGTATVVASGATPGYTYSWAPSGGTGATASGLTAGGYTCTITDANGCSITASITVTEPTALTLATSFVQSTCGNANGSASVVASGATPGYTYSWAPSGGSGATATGLLAGSYTVTVTDANLCTQTATVVVPNAGSPTAAITATVNVSCFGGNDGSATVTPSGGTPPYTYAWAPTGGTGATATGLIAGSYTVTVTDANGCTTTASVTITEPPVLAASATSSPVLCFGGNTGSATVTGAGGVTPYTYSWAPSGGTGATATGLIAGSYTCTVTDANGCTTTASTTVTEPPALTISTTQIDVACNGGNTGAATVTVGGGTPVYTYAWTPSGGTGATESGLAAGSYTCTVTDANGCIITASVTITEPPLLTLTTSFVQSTCGNANGSASVVATGGTPGYNYSWAPSGGTGPNETGLLAGNYTVTVTDSKGCSTSATVVVPNAGSPTAAITAVTNISCFGGNDGSITVTGAGGTLPYTYAWSPSGGTGATETGLIAGSYTVVITDANGCTATADTTLTEPPALTISGTSTNVDCFGNANGTASVVVGGGVTAYTYAWLPSGGASANEIGLIAGTYTCNVTDANGCTISQSLTITEPPQLTLAVAGFNVTCFSACDGQVVVIPTGGVPNYTFLWNTGCNNPSCSNICAGTYNVTVTDANGCVSTATTTVTEPTAISITTAAVDAHCNQADGSVSANASGGTGTLTYQWIGGPANANYNAIVAGTYSVIVTDANGCSDTATVTVNNLNGVNASLVSVTNLTCFQSNDGAIVTNAVGGNGPYVYTWTPNVSTTNTATGIPANSYTLVVTDANGCTSTVTAVVTEPADVTLVASATPGAVCAGNGVQLSSTGGGGTPGYIYSWMPGPLAGNTQNIVPTATTTYTAYVVDANGCADSTTVLVTVNPVPVAILTADQTSGCAPLCVDFSDISTVVAPGVITSWSWDFGDASTSTQQNPTLHCYSTPGAYTVSLTITTADGCTSTIVMPSYINVFALPVAAFGATPQPTTILNPEITFSDSSLNASTWNWSFGDLIPSSTSSLQNPTFTYTTPDCYQVILEVTSIDGCVDTAMKEICIDPDAVIYVPNAFTPNGDGNNEEFIPVSIGIDPDQYELWIFDRWGNMIFYTDDLNKGWDGRVQGHTEISQIDTYVWKIKAVDITGNKHNLLGKVSLIK